MLTEETAADLTGWQPPPAPRRETLAGRFVRLEPLDPAKHAAELFAASHGQRSDPQLWRYLFQGPFEEETPFRAWLEAIAPGDDPLFFAVVGSESNCAAGMTSFMRITPAHGVIEIGNIWFGAAIQRTPATTEAIHLLAREAFDGLGYRRLEWKCDARNERSRRAALRFGFAFEGIFRQHMVVKRRNRDTAWYAMTDADWPAVRAGFERWLDPSNFDGAGRQRQGLAALRERVGDKGAPT